MEKKETEILAGHLDGAAKQDKSTILHTRYTTSPPLSMCLHTAAGEEVAQTWV